MGKRTKSTLPTLKSEKTPSKSPASCKLLIGKMPVEAIYPEIERLVKEAEKAGHSTKFGRGVLTLY